MPSNVSRLLEFRYTTMGYSLELVPPDAMIEFSSQRSRSNVNLHESTSIGIMDVCSRAEIFLRI